MSKDALTWTRAAAVLLSCVGLVGNTYRLFPSNLNLTVPYSNRQTELPWATAARTISLDRGFLFRFFALR